MSKQHMLAKWTDPHQDGIEACIETDPVEWYDDDGNDLTEPVIYVSGDAYLTAVQARELAEHLQSLAGMSRLVTDWRGVPDES